MKSQNSILLLFTCAALIIAGCKHAQQDNNANSNLTAYEKGLTSEDSIQVVAVIDNFFALIENGQVDLAVSSLYKANSEDAYGEPQALDNEEMEQVRKVFEVFPTFGHRIDYIKFFDSYLNEVKVSAIFREAKDGMPEGTTTYYFRPINYIGKWVLCAMNTWTGDDVPLVRDEEKDSLTQKFQKDKQRLDSIVYDVTKDMVNHANGPAPKDAPATQQ